MNSNESARREAFAEANASARLEGREPDAELLGLQERVILGHLTTEQAIALVREQFSRTDIDPT